MSRSTALLTGMAALLAAGPCSSAQAPAEAATVPAPIYGSVGADGKLSRNYFNTPEADGRPGTYYFDLGARALAKHDYAHAIDMFKVAASWAYKPAQYDLALIYFRGEGVPADRPLGAAWAVLAAERKDVKYAQLYTRARDVMISSLSHAEFAQTDQLWAKLKQTYGDQVALRRAKAQWRRVGNMATGSHVGHPGGSVSMGTMGPHGQTPGTTTVGNTLVSPGSRAAFSGGYSEFAQSDDPYSPLFLKNPQGTVSVGTLQPVSGSSSAPARNQGKASVTRSRPTRPAPPASGG